MILYLYKNEKKEIFNLINIFIMIWRKEVFLASILLTLPQSQWEKTQDTLSNIKQSVQNTIEIKEDPWSINTKLNKLEDTQEKNSEALDNFLNNSKYSHLKNSPIILSLLRDAEMEAVKNNLEIKDFYNLLWFAHSKLRDWIYNELTEHTPVFLKKLESAYIWDNSIEFWWITEYFKEKQETKVAEEKTKVAEEKTKVAEQFLEFSKSL